MRFREGWIRKWSATSRCEIAARGILEQFTPGGNRSSGRSLTTSSSGSERQSVSVVGNIIFSIPLKLDFPVLYLLHVSERFSNNLALPLQWWIRKSSSESAETQSPVSIGQVLDASAIAPPGFIQI